MDAGAGALQALGCRFFRADGSEVREPLTGLTIGDCARADCGAVRRLLRGVTVEVLCDVRNPMHGARGAAARKHCRAMFSAERYVEGVARVFDEALEDHAATLRG